MPGEGQFVTPVQVEVTTDIGADVGLDAAAPPGTELRGLAVMGYYEVGNQLFVVRTNAAGELIVQATVTPTPPGTVITSPPDTLVPPAITVPLPAPPVGTTRMTVQVTVGSPLTNIRVRELGGAPGAGRLLTLLASTMYGGDGGAITPLEVENVVGPPAFVSISFEG
jgi:hypothetical protein